jgi:hypothetical protein
VVVLYSTAFQEYPEDSYAWIGFGARSFRSGSGGSAGHDIRRASNR